MCLHPTQAPGAAPGEVCAKLELFLWLGLAKQAKACTSELPPDLLPEPSAGLPHSLYRDGEYRVRGQSTLLFVLDGTHDWETPVVP